MTGFKNTSTTSTNSAMSLKFIVSITVIHIKICWYTEETQFKF